ncbi:MAG TPA: UDP-N-acetylglucosamine 1-carboxyvinyltransferase, partial [Prolixibacteraceae bacterium]|nr:UDP-N-acetylglucosamine 1-carboxyvinyltransferase [Prolixibacteraceae bacterium]
MATFIVEGGRSMKGELHPQGAKNEALQVICATLLTEECVQIRNIPEIRDVLKLIDILKELGVKVDREEKGVFSF